MQFAFVFDYYYTSNVDHAPFIDSLQFDEDASADGALIGSIREVPYATAGQSLSLFKVMLDNTGQPVTSANSIKTFLFTGSEFDDYVTIGVHAKMSDINEYHFLIANENQFLYVKTDLVSRFVAYQIFDLTFTLNRFPMTAVFIRGVQDTADTSRYLAYFTTRNSQTAEVISTDGYTISTVNTSGSGDYTYQGYLFSSSADQSCLQSSTTQTSHSPTFFTTRFTKENQSTIDAESDEVFV